MEDGELVSFIQYAQKYFQAAQKKPKLVSSLIVHEKKLSKPLHKLPTKDLQKLALDQFEQINNFISDKGKSDKGSSIPIDNVIQSFLDTILKNQDIIDETYCLLMKQMTNNKRSESFFPKFNFALY